jgi:RND family efflux transporter MFP subunit
VSEQLSEDLASLKIDRDSGRPSRFGPLVRVLVIVGIVAALGVGAFLAWPYLEAQLFKTEVETTEILSLSPAQAATQLTSTGYVVPEVHTKVAAKIAGRISRVHVARGDVVTQGQTLIDLDPTDARIAIAAARARVAAASARVSSARAALAEVEQQLERTRTLAAAGASPRSTLEDLEARATSMRAAANAAQAEVRVMQAEVDALEANQNEMTIVAPIAGTVIDEPAEVGEMVGPQLAVLEIADMSTLVVEIDVPEGRLSLVRVGNPCEIVLDAFPGERFRGEVQEIARRVNRQKATVPVEVRFVDLNEGVLPDMSARVSFLSEALSEEQLRAASRTIVPADAVVERDGRDVVFEIERGGKVNVRRVTLGEETDDGFVLVDGPEPGTRLVRNPPDTLADGQSVQTEDDE